MLCPSISKENIKIGNTKNINISPVHSCKNLRCLNEGCYAMKAYNMYPNVPIAWDNNYFSFVESPKNYFDNIITMLKRKRKMEYFRWHSAGEIINQTYLNGIFRVCQKFPDTKFLIFTKKYNLNYSCKPDNLEVIFSSWVGMKIPSKIMNNNCIAWMQNGKENRIKRYKRKTFDCPGHCENCRICWSLSKYGKDVVFHKH